MPKWHVTLHPAEGDNVTGFRLEAATAPGALLLAAHAIVTDHAGVEVRQVTVRLLDDEARRRRAELRAVPGGEPDA
jgi:hypothetical protein